MSKITIITVIIGTVMLAACSREVEDRGPSVSSGSEGTKTSTPSKNDAAGETPTETPAEKPAEVSYRPSKKAAGWKAPNRIKVQHILIGVAGSQLPKPNLPSEAEAAKLARDLCDRIRAGEDMDALVRKHTHDSPPGIYSMIESGRPNHGALLFLRGEMATSFGDVSYGLEVGECAIADYDMGTDANGRPLSPFGFHVIKRLE